MSRTAMLLAVFCGFALLGGASAPAQALQDPKMPVVPLAPSQMMPAECVPYQSLVNDPSAQMSFRDTRAFLRPCQRLGAGKLGALDLPLEPKNYDDKYLCT